MRQIQRQINCYLARYSDEFREWLGAPKSYTYGQFKDKILKPAVEEINLKIDDMDLEIFKADIIVKLFKLKYITTGQLSNLNKKEDCSSLKKQETVLRNLARLLFNYRVLLQSFPKRV